jgi:hypothetical protein
MGKLHQDPSHRKMVSSRALCSSGEKVRWWYRMLLIDSNRNYLLEGDHGNFE